MTRNERLAHIALLMARVEDAMAAKGIIQAELARRVDANPANLSKVLNLRSDPRVSTLVAIAEALECDVTLTPRGLP